MPSSMTGMGKSINRGQGVSIEVEMKSVNNRFLLIKNHLPDALMKYEQRLHRLIQQRIKRGTVDLFVRVTPTKKETAFKINRSVLSDYMTTLGKLQKKEKLGGEIRPEFLMGLPGVIESKEKTDIPAKTFSLIETACKDAADRLCRMRGTEGKRMIKAMVRHKNAVDKLLKAVENRISRNLDERIAKLKERISEMLNGQVLAADDPTLQREIAVLVDRSDVTEELDRLKSHMIQFDRIIASGGEIGRQLDFLLQEIGREVNTIGSKVSDATASYDVVKMKSELEKIREQVQNIE